MKKRALVIILAIAMVVSYIPTTTINAISGAPAQNEPVQAEETLTEDQTGDVQKEDVTDDGSSEGQAQPEESVQASEEESPDEDSETVDEGVSETDEKDAVTDDTEKAPQASEKKAKKSAPQKAPADISGNVSGANGWIWKVTGDEGDYTLTFEYTGTAATPPTFTVPANFIANISTQLGDTQQGIKTVIIPEGCTAINTRAFQNLKNLEEVEIASTVTTIGTVVFGDNNSNNAALRDTKLKTVTFKTNDAGKSALTRVEAGAFTGCSALTSVNLEDTQLTFIGYEAFRSCALEEVNIPDSIAKSTAAYNSSNSNYQIAGYAFADNKKLKSVSVPAFFYIPYNVGTYTFSNCTSLEDVVFREVEGATARTYNASTLPNQTFLGDTSLKTVDLSAWGESSRSTTFSLSYSIFETSGTGSTTKLMNLEKFILPEKNITVGNNTFYNKTGINSWDQFENEEYITSIGDRAFYGTRIGSCDMSDMTRLTTIGMEAFKNCEDMTDLVIPENVTSIGSAAFKNCDNLETVRIEAKNLTSVGNSNLFHGDDSLRSVTISDKTKKLNGNVLAAVPDDADTFFEGENVIQITKASAGGGQKPLKTMNGTYYVDAEGVVYKLGEDGKASLAYVPPGIDSYTVPETFTTPAGDEYTVNAVDPYAVSLADDLNALTFEAPENVNLKAHAFTGWSTSTDNKGNIINGKEALDEEEWAKVSNICDFPINDPSGTLVETLEDTIYNADHEETLKVIVAVNDKNPESDKTYDYKTGEQATLTFAINNGDNVVLNKDVRIYFSYSDEGYNMGSFPVGTYNIKNSATGTVYPMKVVQTDEPGVYYYEITGIKPGETLVFQNDIFYPSPSTGGGEVKIWTHTISHEESVEKEGQVINPSDYMELDWITTPLAYRYAKSNSTVYSVDTSTLQSPMIITNPSGDAYVSSLAYRLTETNPGGTSTTAGLDYIRWVNYEDEIQLPEELYFRPEIISMLNAGNYQIEDASTHYDYVYDSQTTSKAITVTYNGTKYYVAYLAVRNGYGSSYIDNLKAKVTGEGKLKLSWKVSNTSLSGASASNEYTVHSFFLRFGENVVMADLDKVNELLDENPGANLKDLLKIHNETKEVRHYSYSDNQEAKAAVNTPVDANYNVLTTKTYQNYEGSSYRSIYGGQDDFFNLTINNTGILNLTKWGKPSTDDEGNKTYNGNIETDNFSNYYYITPANIEAMFRDKATMGTGSNAQTVQLGDWLTLTINKASLFTEDQYQPVDGTDQNNKYTTGSNSNISATADNGVRVYENAKMVFTRNADGTISVALSGDTKTENNKTFIIGAGGDYLTVEAFFNAIGYMPTSGTTYSTSHTLREGEEFTLKAGQKLVIPLRTTFKTTPMMLTGDAESYHPTSSVSVTNTATINVKVGEEDVSRSVYPQYKSGSSLYRNYRYWYRELYFYKSGYIEGGSSLNADTLINDGTVIDGCLYFYNYNGKAYEHMPVSDYMDGPQVALAPVAQNPTLTAPDGSPLETYTSNGVTYYVLNKLGEYKNVTFGSPSGRNSTQTLKADITVTETRSGGKRTSLNTLIKWNPYKNWGSTSSTTYIYYKNLTSASLSGLVSSENPGEVERFTLNNKAWLGDHQGHRLWDKLGVYSQVYSFSKHIITEDGKKDGTDTVADGTLVSFSRLRHSAKVTYQIDVNNITASPAVLSGNRIRDALPRNYGLFNWEKGVNVTNLRYFGSDGVEIKYGEGDDAVSISTEGEAGGADDAYWNIENTTTAGLQQIKWDKDFKVYYPANGTLKILVDLEFPARPAEGSSVWDQYVAANAGNQLENRFYLDGRSSYVEHLLESEGKAVLYKGVVDTGLTTRYVSDPSSTNKQSYTSNNTRVMYQNGSETPSAVNYNSQDFKASTITYYTVLYNGSYDRLYLSDLQDQLPRGFVFQSMCNTASTTYWTDSDGNYTPTSDTQYSSHNWTGYGRYGNTIAYDTISEGYSNASTKLVTINNSGDEYDNNKVKYINARVSSSAKMGDDGRQHITFTVKGHPSNANGSDGIIKYDSEVGKYYLNPGEAVRFGYNVLIGKHAETDDLATNTITMPYYDYYNTGFQNAKETGTVQKPYTVSGITPNDGTCTMMTGTDVHDQYGVDISKYSDPAYSTQEKGNYMVSSVTVQRAPIAPGMQKTVGGLTTKAVNPSAATVEGSTGTSNSDSSRYGTAYKGGAKTSDVINWKLRVFNEAPGRNEDAAGMMTDYDIVDTVDAPYGFTGRVFYNMFRGGSASGTKVTAASQYLFTLGTRTIWSDESQMDQSVRIVAGSAAPNASGSRMLRIGDAEDDSDDDWFQFGTGSKSGRVKIERTADGKEVMTIKMTGSAYSVPAGFWADFCVHTMYTKDEVIISEPKYNDSILYPDQDYDPASVAQGKARTKEEYDDSGELVTKNDGIQSGISIMLTQGYTTASWKKITEIGKTSNTARSDEPDNYIALSEKTKNVKYDMYVVGPQAVMSKIVIIDDLPHIGDHSAFVESDKRYTEFKMSFLENDLGLRVAVAKKEGQAETVLNENQYDAYISTKTEFDRKTDWEGAGEGWTKLSDLTAEEKVEALKDARSIRIVIKDANAWKKNASYLMGSECQVHVSFNAKIDDKNAEPGQMAWNSFGYKYQVPQTQNGSEENSFAISLEAQPLNVGIKYPAAPLVKKKLTEEHVEIVEKIDEETGEPTTEEVVTIEEHKAEKDENFGFIVYEGEPLAALDDALQKEKSQVVDILEQAGRKYIYVPCQVKAGESEGELGLWTVDYCSQYDADSDEFTESEDKWTWVDAAKYSVVELNMGSYAYALDSFTIGKNNFKKNNLVFTNSADTKLTIAADNRRYQARGELELKGKKSVDKRETLEDHDVYRFTVSENGEVLQTVENDGNGDIGFENIEYILDDEREILGLHTYTVREETVGENGITSDTKKYTLKINVTDNGDGTLSAEPADGSVDPEALDFTNIYEAEGKTEMSVRKVLEGRDWKKKDRFSFSLKAVDGAPMPDGSEDGEKTVTIDRDTADLTASFGDITYTMDDMKVDGKYVKEKTFTYEMKEIIPDVEDQPLYITYDENTYIVEVKVTDNTKGKLTAEKSIRIKDSEDEPAVGDKGESEITNVYEAIRLKLTKKMPERIEIPGSGENATLVFKITGRNKDGKVIYENHVGMVFDADSGSWDEVIIEDVPKNAKITVEEEYGGNYESGTPSVTKTSPEDVDGEQMWVFEFENTPTDDEFSSGIVNHYDNTDDVISFEGKED